MKEGEIINELRSPKDLVSKPTDIEWAASDRPVIATADGCLRIMSLALSLAASAGPLEATEAVSCRGLLPNKVKENLKVMCHHQPWNTTPSTSTTPGGFTFEPSDGLTPVEADLIRAHLGLMEESHWAYLSNPSTSTLQRCRLASQICNSSNFEVDFWTVASVFLEPAASNLVSLDTRYDLTADCASYLRYQLERLHLHESKLNNGDLRRRVIDQMLCLGLKVI